MRELAAVIVSFLIIPILSKKKIPIGIAICISAFLMAFLGGLGVGELWDVIVDTFVNFNKLQQFIIIIEISVLGVLLRRYEIINKIIDYLTKLVRSNHSFTKKVNAVLPYVLCL
jgi:hypothetical protein